MCVLLPAAQDPALTRRLCTALAVILARAQRTPECGTWIVYGPLGRVANPGVSRAAYPQPSITNATAPLRIPGSGAVYERARQALPMFLSTFSRT